MSKTQIPKKVIFWQDIQLMTQYLYYQIQESKYKPEHIFGIHRGGMVLAIMLSHLLKIPCHAIAATHWPNNKKTKKVVFARHVLYIAKNSNLVSGRALICDDLADSGESFPRSEKKIKTKFRNLTEFKTAAYFYKTRSKFRPDFVAGSDIGPDENGKFPWIDFPWEITEVCYPKNVIEKMLQNNGLLIK